MKLRIGETSVFEVSAGVVRVNGLCVELFEEMRGKAVNACTTIEYELVVAYCLKPGDKVRRISEGEYAVEY